MVVVGFAKAIRPRRSRESVMLYQSKVPVREMILHCADIPTGMAFRRSSVEWVKEVDAWHKKRGFRGIGYHYVITPDGECSPGRRDYQIGAHTAGHNVGTLGVLLLEREAVEQIAPFSRYFSAHQWRAVRDLAFFYGIEKVSGHNDYANKLCPGFKVPRDFLQRMPTSYK